MGHLAPYQTTLVPPLSYSPTSSSLLLSLLSQGLRVPIMKMSRSWRMEIHATRSQKRSEKIQERIVGKYCFLHASASAWITRDFLLVEPEEIE